ncbi:ABC transporter permease [Schaalia sp. lx-260]|uniref:ABC transporter permease n=1 Tax=Schaalia sp. lx-260 TaxID=2899082 RepID=UPI001E5DAA5A|nr:ABC transporter permease [Schaalia sp. lx-260]MCD4550012.1 ABC transporter permease [Schaalia sp. lx-260]
MNQLLRANLRTHARRYIATGLAVVISTAFIMTCLSLGAGLQNSLTQRITDRYHSTAAIVSYSVDSSHENSAFKDMDQVADAIQTIDGVKNIHKYWMFPASAITGEEKFPVFLTTLATEPFTQPHIVEGKVPAKASEITIDSAQASSFNLHVGDSLTITIDSAGVQAAKNVMTISGITKEPLGAFPSAVVLPEGAKLILGSFQPHELLISDGNVQPSADTQKNLVERIETRLGKNSGFTVQTAHAALEKELEQARMGGNTSLAMILVFPLIAAAVAIIVVSTTFQVVMTQRRREFALLRAIGAKTRQVRSLVICEAVMIGVISALIGVLCGAALGAGILAYFDLVHLSLSTLFPVTSMVITWASATFVTLLVALRPALNMARISPVAALSPLENYNTEAKKSRRIFLIIFTLVFLASAASMSWFAFSSTNDHAFIFALASGFVALIASMILCAALLPYVAYGLGRLTRGIIPQIARENIIRSTGRSGATAVAITIGVTLMTMMALGAFSVQKTLITEVDTQRPYDLNVSTENTEISSDLQQRIATTRGVQVTVPVRQINATLSQAHKQSDAEVMQFILRGYPDLNSVAHSPVEPIADDTVLLPDMDFHVNDGDKVTVCVTENTCATLTGHIQKNVYDGVLRVSERTLTSLSPQAPVGMVIVKLASDADAITVQSDLASIDSSLSVDGAAIERAMYMKIIHVILMIVLGLLGISVIVALVGVTNTLSLSVHERTRENGLLRALGMKRKDMRWMLAVEALLIACAATLTGIILGTGFGIAGVYALPISTDHTLIVFPWGIVAGMSALAIGAALVASWLPGRRASRTSPVEALAHE